MSVGQKFVCRVCGGSEIKAYNIKEMMFGWKDTFKYMECSTCGCLQIENYVSDVAQYYPEDYYSFKSFEADNFRTRGFRAQAKRFLTRLNQLYLGDFLTPIFGKGIQPRYDKYEYLKIVNPKLSASILDIGCGNGSHLCQLYKIGFSNLSGVDKYILKSEVLFDRIKIRKCDLEDLSEQYDLITMHHVFEHMPDQMSELQKVKKLLKKDGKLVIRIPVKAKAWETYKEDWVQIDAPRHYYLHTVESLERVVSDADMKLIKVVFDSTAFQFWGSEQYKQGISLFRNNLSYRVNKSLFDKETTDSWTRLSVEFNHKHQGDQAIFIVQVK